MTARRTGVLGCLFGIVFSLALSGCATTERDWQEANRLATVRAYELFLQKHPQSNHTKQANAALDDLRFEQAKASDSIVAYESYLKHHPDGSGAEGAQSRLHELRAELAEEQQEKKAWDAVKSSGDVAAIDNFLKTYSDSGFATQARQLRLDLVQAEARAARLKEDIRNSCLNIEELRPGNPGNKLPGVYVKNGSYKVFRSRYNTTGIEITGGNGGLDAQGGLPGGAGDNYVYRFINKSTIITPGGQRIVFEGDSHSPITFVLTADKGLVYLEGDGKVIIKDKSVMLPGRVKTDVFDNDTSLSYQELKQKYNWNGVSNLVKANPNDSFLVEGSKVTGEVYFGNLQIEGAFEFETSGLKFYKGTVVTSGKKAPPSPMPEGL